MKKLPKNPMQPLVVDDKGTIRFKDNKIVQHLLKVSGVDLNQLALMGFSIDDQEQFAQLTGWSVDGYSDLPFVTDTSRHEANKAANKLR